MIFGSEDHGERRHSNLCSGDKRTVQVDYFCPISRIALVQI
jgi:hypothetical protein